MDGENVKFEINMLEMHQEITVESQLMPTKMHHEDDVECQREPTDKPYIPQLLDSKDRLQGEILLMIF